MNKVLEIYISLFLPLAVHVILSPIPELSPNYFIIWTGDHKIDSLINSTKAKSLQFLNSLLLYYRKIIDNKLVIEHCSKIVEPAVKNLAYVIKEKFDYISKMEKGGEVEDNNYEVLIYQIFLFFSRFITKEPIIDNFSSFIQP